MGTARSCPCSNLSGSFSPLPDVQRQPLRENGAARLKQLHHHQTLTLGYGCDRQMRVLRVQDVLAVRRAERAGRIGRETDGSWDLTKVRAAWADNTDPGQQRGELSVTDGSKAAKRAVKPVPEAAIGAVRDTLREHGEAVAAGGMTFIQARTANEVLKAQERRVRLQRMKGELVDRAKAVAQVFRLAATSAMPGSTGRARVAAMIAAESRWTHRARAACPGPPRRARRVPAVFALIELKLGLYAETVVQRG